jgi:hypothetical protein
MLVEILHTVRAAVFGIRCRRRLPYRLAFQQ